MPNLLKVTEQQELRAQWSRTPRPHGVWACNILYTKLTSRQSEWIPTSPGLMTDAEAPLLWFTTLDALALPHRAEKSFLGLCCSQACGWPLQWQYPNPLVAPHTADQPASLSLTSNGGIGPSCESHTFNALAFLFGFVVTINNSRHFS